MKQALIKYNEHNLITFGITITHDIKKKIKFPQNWTAIRKSTICLYNNGLAMLTGKVNNIIVLDIDDIDEWENLLTRENKLEPNTVKVITGSGGYHYYFKYSDDLAEITSKDHAIEKFAIDIKTNGGCVICPPSSYTHSEKGTVTYKFEKNKSFADLDPIELPQWIVYLLLAKQMKKIAQPISANITSKKKNPENTENCEELINCDEKLNAKSDVMTNLNIEYTQSDIEHMINILSEKRCENYNDWISVGMVLYNLSIKDDYKYIFHNFSKNNSKYDPKECNAKWKSFKKIKGGFGIGSLIKWCQEDNSKLYDEFINNRKKYMIITKKFDGLVKSCDLSHSVKKNDNLIIFETSLQHCPIYGKSHEDDNISCRKICVYGSGDIYMHCNDEKCVDCRYPNDCVKLSKSDIGMFYGCVFNGPVTINQCGDTEIDQGLVEFQNIELFDDNDLNILIYEGMNGKSGTLANIIYYHESNKYIFAEDNNWYMFCDKWTNVKSKNSELRLDICEIIKKCYNVVLKYYKTHGSDKQTNMIKAIINSSSDALMKNNIMTELIDIYTKNKNPKRDFLKKIDDNFKLIGFENGVYDLSKLEFRSAKYDDYVSMSVKYNYNSEYSDKKQELLQFLTDIQPNIEEREYMLTYLSIALIGNQLELFTIMTGKGRNGKSKLIELLKLSFGDYFGATQSQMFTRPRPDASSPDPGLLNLIKKRLVIASEPEKQCKLNSGFIKFITGRDSTTLRSCHSNDMVDFMPRFITILICNDIPECDDLDAAFSKRLRCIHFPTEFVSEPVKSYQKKIDETINSKFEYWKMDFMLLLIEYYKKYITTKTLKPTSAIFAWTKQYEIETDIYMMFLNECVVESNTHLHITTLYECFKIWFKQNNPCSKLPNNREFKTNISRYHDILKVRVGESIATGIKNISLLYN